MSRPKKSDKPEDELHHTTVRIPKWLRDQILLVQALHPDKKTFSDCVTYVLMQGVEKIAQDRERTVFERIESMVTRTEDMVLTLMAYTVLESDAENADVEAQKQIIEKALSEKMKNRAAEKRKKVTADE